MNPWKNPWSVPCHDLFSEKPRFVPPKPKYLIISKLRLSFQRQRPSENRAPKPQKLPGSYLGAIPMGIIGPAPRRHTEHNWVMVVSS